MLICVNKSAGLFIPLAAGANFVSISCRRRRQRSPHSAAARCEGKSVFPKARGVTPISARRTCRKRRPASSVVMFPSRSSVRTASSSARSSACTCANSTIRWCTWTVATAPSPAPIRQEAFPADGFDRVNDTPTGLGYVGVQTAALDQWHLFFLLRCRAAGIAADPTVRLVTDVSHGRRRQIVCSCGTAGG